jgi:alkyldihydroxyacetonephosphate synthase
MELATRRRSFWGWGDEEGELDAAQREALGGMIASRFGATDLRELTPPRLEDLRLPAPRLSIPRSLAPLFSQDARERASHTYGKAFRDVVRGLEGDYRAAPDAVALPATEEDLVRILDHCASQGIAAIPYGGGSSAVGGVEARLPGEWPGVVSIDLRGLGAVLEIDKMSRAARIQGGIYGPALEAALRPHGLTLRHFPQSFEFSTLGGWIATRSGGHFATLSTHIDDFVESLRVVTPAGSIATRRLPGSGAGPSPDRMFMGSEGALGIITEAWMRLQARPRFRASMTARFVDFRQGAAAARELAQSGLYPSNCRLIDAQEAMNTGAGDGTRSLLLVAFESADHPLDAWMDRAITICRACGGEAREGAGRTRETRETQPESAGAAGSAGARDADDAGGAWRSMFLKAPYLRDALIRTGLIVETFETAITWDRFDDFHAGVSAAARDAAVRICGQAIVTCRLTHVYPDGAAPYFTVIAPARPGSQLAQWDEIKAAASEAILSLGGTITHHHAVGRDHRRWYDRERPDLFARALGAAKAALDPAGVMNPGVLL